MDIKTAIEEFLLAREADGVSKATRDWYYYMLKSFNEQYSACGLESVTTRQLREFIVSLRNRKAFQSERSRPAGELLSEDTIADHTNALHRFFKWCSVEYDIKNPMTNIRRPRLAPKSPKGIQPDDLRKLWNATGDDTGGYRDRAILAFLADTGCRAQGVLNLTLENLEMERGRALAIEKRTRQRMLMFTPFTAEHLRTWLMMRPVKRDYVFYGLRSYEPLTRSGLSSMLKRLGERAGVEGRYNAHSFRHGFARQYLTAGGDLATLAQLLGHTDIETTATYYAVFNEGEVAKQHGKYSQIQVLNGGLTESKKRLSMD